ncbi:MAG: glycosyltransferase family 4 protein [Muribaculaceae bacterium]|nr:glycosyltransferase family 4 protein [Muribaculaceae bacterium]
MNIYHLISNKVWGGGEQYVLDLARRQREDGHYVEIVCRYIDAIIAPFKEAEFPISTLPLKGIADIDSARRLGRIIKKSKQVVIHTHNFKDAFTGCLARKYSGNKQNVRVVVSRQIIRIGKNNFTYRVLYKHIDKIIMLSELAKQEFLKGNPSIDESKFAIPLGTIEEAMHTPKNLHEIYNIPLSKKIIMFHGRITKEKGIETLIRAFALLDRSKFHAIITGSGDKDFMQIVDNIIIANNLAANITFTGYVDFPQEYVAGCDFGVIPSIVPEGLCFANMEYMMQGKPVISSNNGGQKEYIDNGVDGILITPGDAALLASTIDSLLDDDRLCQRIGEAARKKYYSLLSYERFYERMTKIYNDLW